MGGKRSRNKGYRGEREMELILEENGFDVQKVSDHGFPGDLLLNGHVCQVKRRETGFLMLYQWIEKARYLFCRKNNEEWLVVMRLKDFMELKGF